MRTRVALVTLHMNELRNQNTWKIALCVAMPVMEVQSNTRK